MRTFSRIFAVLLFVCSIILVFYATKPRAFAAPSVGTSVGCDPDGSDLVDAIQTAVTNGGTQVIDLAANCTYSLTAANNGRTSITRSTPGYLHSSGLTARR